MMTDHTNKRFCASLGELAKLLIAWHKEDNTSTRSALMTWKWNLSECNGGYMRHVTGFVELLSSVGSLEAAGCAVTDCEINALGQNVITEDSFVQFHGTAIFSLSGYRQRRNLANISG